MTHFLEVWDHDETCPIKKVLQRFISYYKGQPQDWGKKTAQLRAILIAIDENVFTSHEGEWQGLTDRYAAEEVSRNAN